MKERKTLPPLKDRFPIAVKPVALPPPVPEPERVIAEPVAPGLSCPACKSPMYRGSEAKGGAGGCLVLVVGVLFCLTGIGLILGIPIILAGAHFMMKRDGLWICGNCGSKIPRKLQWFELG